MDGENKTAPSVEFRNVRFGYDKNKTIIKNFSASVKSGQKVAIVGPKLVCVRLVK